MRNNFRTYHLSVDFYKQCKGLVLSRNLRDQLDRASSSICLNLAEGSGRPSKKEQARFFSIAFGSLRECQAIIDLANEEGKLAKQADTLAAHVYRLIEVVKRG